jgi:hypothetical protein
MMRCLCLALLMLFLGISAASAHTRSQSFSAWTVGATELEGVYQVDAYRATQLSEAPQDLVKLLSSPKARDWGVFRCIDQPCPLRATELFQ